MAPALVFLLKRNVQPGSMLLSVLVLTLPLAPLNPHLAPASELRSKLGLVWCMVQEKQSVAPSMTLSTLGETPSPAARRVMSQAVHTTLAVTEGTVVWRTRELMRSRGGWTH
jgi:hypothetical protein